MNLLFLGFGLFFGSIFGVFFISLCLSAKMGDSKMQATDANRLAERPQKKRPLPINEKKQKILSVVEMWG